MNKTLIKAKTPIPHLLPLGKTVVTSEPWFDGRKTCYDRRRYTIEKVNRTTYDIKDIDTENTYRVAHEELHYHAV